MIYLLFLLIIFYTVCLVIVLFIRLCIILLKRLNMARYKKGWYYTAMEFKSNLATQCWILGNDVRDFVRANYRSSSFYKIYLVNGTEQTLVGSCGNPMAFENFLRYSKKLDEQYNKIHEK